MSAPAEMTDRQKVQSMADNIAHAVRVLDANIEVVKQHLDAALDVPDDIHTGAQYAGKTPGEIVFSALWPITVYAKCNDKVRYEQAARMLLGAAFADITDEDWAQLYRELFAQWVGPQGYPVKTLEEQLRIDANVVRRWLHTRMLERGGAL